MSFIMQPNDKMCWIELLKYKILVIIANKPFYSEFQIVVLLFVLLSLQ